MPADPYFDRLMALVQRVGSGAPMPAGDPALVARLSAMSVPQEGYQPPAAEVEDAAVPGPHGDIPVRVYRPAAATKDAPGLVWCHGGGWVGGGLDMPEADATAREMCVRAGAVVVSVDYRLAVEGVFYPVPLDDVVAAFRWTVRHAASLGMAAGRVSLGGGSAGANLAAGAALRLRDEGGPLPASSLLIYPAVHPELPAASEELAAKTAGLTAAMAFAPEVYGLTVENYIGGPAATAVAYAMPAVGKLAGLPPTLVINCEYDGLRASGEAYALALQKAGVQVEQYCAPDVPHGHLNAPWLPAAGESFDQMALWLKAS